MSNPTVAMLSGACGLILGVLVMVLGSFPNVQDLKKAILDNPWVATWLCLIGIQTGIWTMIGLALNEHLAQKWTLVKGNRKQLSLVFIVFGILFIPGAFRPKSLEPVLHYQYKIALLALFYLVVASSIAAAIRLVQIETRETGHNTSESTPSISRYLSLRHELQSLLMMIGLMLVVGILAFGALFKAVPRFPFHPSYILVFGLYYSFLLALISVPAFLELTRVGNGIVDIVFSRVPTPDSESFATWYSNRRKLEELLQLPKSGSLIWKPLLAVLSPLFASLVSLLLDVTAK